MTCLHAPCFKNSGQVQAHDVNKLGGELLFTFVMIYKYLLAARRQGFVIIDIHDHSRRLGLITFDLGPQHKSSNVKHFGPLA